MPENEPDYMEELLEDMEAREEIVSDVEAMSEIDPRLIFTPETVDWNNRTHILALTTIAGLTSIAEEMGKSPLEMQGLILDFIGDLIDFHNGGVLYSVLSSKLEEGTMTLEEALAVVRHTNIRPAAGKFVADLLKKRWGGDNSENGQ